MSIGPMDFILSPAVFFLSLALSASFASCTPQLAFPINSQFPQVGRASQPYSFTFAESTFSSVVSSIQYELRDAPVWLRLDGVSRTFYGYPAEIDVGEVNVKLVAKDDTGELVHIVQLIVSKDPGPKVRMPSEVQLPQFGKMYSNGGFIIPHGQQFSFPFALDTFTEQNKIKRYNAVLSNNTPLPSWLNFDEKRLEFSGRSPLLASQQVPPQIFSVKLIAEDIIGFEGASVGFTLVLNHQLRLVKPYLRVSATAGMYFSYGLPLDLFLLDGQPIPPALIQSATANASDWLTFTGEKLILSGRPFPGSKSHTVTILVKDIYENEASINIGINVVPVVNLFTQEIISLNVTRGEEFQFQLNPTIFGQATQLSAVFTPDVNWIFLNESSMLLSGKAPMDAGGVIVNVTAEGVPGYLGSQILDIIVNDLLTQKPQVTNSESSEGQKEASKPRVKVILLATLIPLAVLIVCFLLLVFVARRRFTSFFYARTPRERAGTPTCDMISRPIHTSATTQPWPVATLPGKSPHYTRVVERKYGPGPGFIGIGPTSKSHNKNPSIGSNLLMRMGDSSFASPSSSEATISTLESTAGTPRRLASIPTLTRIVSGEPIKNPSVDSGTLESEESRNWEYVSRGSEDSFARAASARKSWRRTMMWASKAGTRDSDGTVDTVSTTEVFSVKLVGSPILIGDGSQMKQWQPKGLQKAESKRETMEDQNVDSVYEWDFGDTTNERDEKRWIPRPSTARHSLRAYRCSRGTGASDPFEDYGIALSSPTIPRPPIQGTTATVGLDQNDSTKGKSLVENENMDAEESKITSGKTGVKKGILVGYGWKF